MRFPPSFLDEIRARLPVSAVVGARVSWDRRKSNPAKGDFWACCPFHGEKSPSFHADDRRGRYHCFGCGVSGDQFTFLVEKEGLSFPEAVERLAAEAGLAMPARDRQSEERERRRASLYDVMEFAARFFQDQLQAAPGAAARSYLSGRRLGPDVQRRFRLGYAPPGRNALKEHLAAKGVAVPQMVEAGLLVAGDDIPVAFDRFRDRVIFPIEDARGRVVAFGGRALSSDVPAKYLNSPETPLFQKGALLYNAAAARPAIQAAGTVLVAEGYVDVIALVVAGFGHAVAPLGTALTDRQLDLLWRLAPEPVLCFDGDGAGLRAAGRVLDLALPLLKPGRSLRFALLPEGQDPDDLIRAAGPQAMADVLAAARPMVDMIWARETEGGVFETPERRAEVESRLIGLARTIADPAVRRHYEQALSERVAAFFAPAEQAPRRRFGNERRGGFGQQPGGRKPAPIAVSDALSRLTRLSGPAAAPLREVVLVMTFANHPRLLERHLDDFAALELTHRELDSLRRQLLEIAADDPEIDVVGLIGRLHARGFAPLLERLGRQVDRSGSWQVTAASSDEDAGEGWRQAAALHRKSRTLHKELKDAEAELAADPSDANLARIIEIQNQLASTDGTEALIEGFGSSSGR